jgi:hypothetical protein
MDLSPLYYLGAFITAMVGFFLSESVRKKNEASTAQSLTESAMKMLEAKDKEMLECKEEKKSLRLYIAYLLTGIKLLQKQIRGFEPPEFNPLTIDEFQNGD